MTRNRQPEVSAVSIRTEWHETDQGCWALSIGDHGCRVGVFQREPGGVFYRRTWNEGGYDTRSLKTRNRDVAEKRGVAFYRALLHGETPKPRHVLELGELWNLYKERCARYTSNKVHTQADQKSRAELLVSYFGERQKCELLTLNDVDRYQVARRRGGLQRPGGKHDRNLTPPVGPRTVEADMKLLYAMLQWACKERGPDGRWLLEQNPLRGLKLPKETNPRRPVADFEDFLQVEAKTVELARTAKTDASRRKWLLLKLALVLVEATGRRIGAVRQLRWGDFEANTSGGQGGAAIRWRKEFDKAGREMRVAVPEELALEIRELRVALGAVGDGWMFRKSRTDEPKCTASLSEWLRQAMQYAEVDKEPGSLWHAFRRKWATERKDLPTRDVMAVGGWHDERTFRTCYEQADEGTMATVMAHPKKLVGGKLVLVR